MFDDAQLEILTALKAGGRHAPLGGAPIIARVVGRVGARQTDIDSRAEMVPVRVHPASRVLNGLPATAGGRAIYDQEILGMRGGRLEALVACLYAARGCQVILMPEGGVTGTSLIAIQNGAARLVLVQTQPAGLESLEAIARMRTAFRRLHDLPYELALVVRSQCSHELVSRARVLRMELMDTVGLIDAVEAEAIMHEHLCAVEQCRCASMLDGIEHLRRVLPAGDFVEKT